MGTNASLQAPRKPLVPQRNFEATIHRRYVKDTVTTLEFEDRFWSKPHDHVIEIKDVVLNKVMFRIPPSTTTASGTTTSTATAAAAAAGESPQKPVRKLLLDTYGVPVVGLEPYPVLPEIAHTTEFAVIPGGVSATKEVFRFTTRFNMFEFPLQLEFNADSPENCVQIVVTRKWLSRHAYVSVKRGVYGAMYAIARVYADDVRDGKFRMDIAPGVDISLMVLFAAAMETENPKYMTAVDRQHIKYLIKQSEKRGKATEASR